MKIDAKDYVTRQGERMVHGFLSKYGDKTVLVNQQFSSMPEQMNEIADYLPFCFVYFIPSDILFSI